MPYDSNGNASLPTGYLAVAGQTILPSQHNPPLEDIASMLSQVLLRSGVAPMTGPLNMNTRKIVNLADGTNDADAVTLSQFNDTIAGLGADHIISVKTGNYTTKDTDFNLVFNFTSAATLTLPLSADLRDYWFCTVVAYGGDVRITPNVLDTIDGQSSTTGILVRSGQVAYIYRTGETTFASVSVGNPFRGSSAVGRRGLDLTRSGQFGVIISSGSIGSDDTIPTLMVLPSNYTKQLNSGWAVGSGNGGLDTGTIGSGTYYAYLIRRPDTGVTDVLFSLSSSSPTMPVSYTQKALIGSFVRSDNYTMPFPNEPQVWSADFGQLNMPVETIVMVQDASAISQRGALVNVYLKTGNSAAYTVDSSLAIAGQQMLGTWRFLGLISATTGAAQKVAY